MELTVEVTDTLANWEDSDKKYKGADDSVYYRRYLNDVS